MRPPWSLIWSRRAAALLGDLLEIGSADLLDSGSVVYYPAVVDIVRGLTAAGLLTIALLACSSPTAPTTAPTGAPHPREALITDLTRCYAESRGVVGEITVGFADDLGDIDCSYYRGSGARCSVVGRAFPYSNAVTFWGPWVRGETEHSTSVDDLALAAAHEACHLSGVWREVEADSCSTLLVDSTDCLPRHPDEAP